MLQVAPSENASSSKSYTDVYALVTDVSMIEDFDGHQMDSMKVMPVSSDNDKEEQDEGEEVSIIKFHENAFNTVEVIFHIDQIYEVFRPPRTINVDHKERHETPIRRQGFDYIIGLVMVTPSHAIQKNGEDFT